MKITSGDIDRSHYVSNLLVLNFVYALLKISNEDNLEPDEKGLIYCKNLNYDDGLLSMLNELLISLEKEIHEFLFRDEHKKIASKLKHKVESKMHYVLEEVAKENISLEVLAMYIMRENFVEADIIHENFIEFTDETKYSIVVNTSLGRVEVHLD